MVGHFLNSTNGCDKGKNSLLHGASIYLRFSPGQSLVISFFVCFSCACLMRPPSLGTKPYQADYLSQCLLCFCEHMYSFAGLIRRTPPPTFGDTAITDRHSDIRAHWVRISWSFGSDKKKNVRTCAAVGVEPSTSCENGEHPIH